MPRANVHAGAGAAAGVAWCVIYCRKSGIGVKLPDLIVASAVGLAGGLLADLLEPALDPNHRKFAHSIIVAIGLVVLIGIISRSFDSMTEQHRLILGAMTVAYLSHLMLDSATPKSIPLIG
jgi:membrane-bound metal-dependent hydrolase YbcI (DUF457 family)